MASMTIIGISGASGAGKSRFSETLCSRLRATSSDQVSILKEDYYYHARDDMSLEARAQINYDHPDALEHELLVNHLDSLRAGKTVEVPQYDYAQHNRTGETKTFAPTSILILEGILILNDPEVRKRLDLKIFVDVALDICLLRRCQRDIQERGRDLDSVFNQYQTTVRPMYFEFIAPTKNHADLIVPGGGENQNALTVIQSHLESLLVSR